jgi:hypothetical protein
VTLVFRETDKENKLQSREGKEMEGKYAHVVPPDVMCTTRYKHKYIIAH